MNFIELITKEFDTQTSVKIAIIGYGDSTQNPAQVDVTMGPVQFATQSFIQSMSSNIPLYGQTTASGGAIDEAVNQLDTSDNISDVIIVLTDGWDSDRGSLETAAANAAAAGVTGIAASYLVSQLTNLMLIANQQPQHVHQVIGSSEVIALAALVVDDICSAGLRSKPVVNKPPKTLHNFIYEAAAKFIDTFGRVPSWIPQYKLWKEGKIQHFTSKRRFAPKI